MLTESEENMADHSIRLATIAIGTAHTAHAERHAKKRFTLAQTFLSDAIAQLNEHNTTLARFYAERAKSEAEHALVAARHLETIAGPYCLMNTGKRK